MNDNKQWPETVDQAVGVLLGMLPEDETTKIAAMSRDDLINLHLGLGAWIRNNFGLWAQNTALLENTGKSHPDDAAGVIMEALWSRLQSMAPKLH